MHRPELMALAVGHERLENAILEIHALDRCEGRCKDIAATALNEAAHYDVEEGPTDIYQRMLNNDWEDVGCLDFCDDDLVED